MWKLGGRPHFMSSVLVISVIVVVVEPVCVLINRNSSDIDCVFVDLSV